MGWKTLLHNLCVRVCVGESERWREWVSGILWYTRLLTTGLWGNIILHNIILIFVVIVVNLIASSCGFVLNCMLSDAENPSSPFETVSFCHVQNFLISVALFLIFDSHWSLRQQQLFFLGSNNKKNHIRKSVMLIQKSRWSQKQTDGNKNHYKWNKKKKLKKIQPEVSKRII